MTVADYKEKLKSKILNNASNVARYILEKNGHCDEYIYFYMWTVAEDILTFKKLNQRSGNIEDFLNQWNKLSSQKKLYKVEGKESKLDDLRWIRDAISKGYLKKSEFNKTKESSAKQYNSFLNSFLCMENLDAEREKCLFLYKSLKVKLSPYVLDEVKNSYQQRIDWFNDIYHTAKNWKEINDIEILSVISKMHYMTEQYVTWVLREKEEYEVVTERIKKDEKNENEITIKGLWVLSKKESSEQDGMTENEWDSKRVDSVIDFISSENYEPHYLEKGTIDELRVIRGMRNLIIHASIDHNTVNDFIGMWLHTMYDYFNVPEEELENSELKQSKNVVLAKMRNYRTESNLMSVVTNLDQSLNQLHNEFLSGQINMIVEQSIVNMHLLCRLTDITIEYMDQLKTPSSEEKQQEHVLRVYEDEINAALDQIYAKSNIYEKRMASMDELIRKDWVGYNAFFEKKCVQKDEALAKTVRKYLRYAYILMYEYSKNIDNSLVVLELTRALELLLRHLIGIPFAIWVSDSRSRLDNIKDAELKKKLKLDLIWSCGTEERKKEAIEKIDITLGNYKYLFAETECGNFLIERFNSGMDKETLQRNLKNLGNDCDNVTNNYRNKAAHGEELTQSDAKECIKKIISAEKSILKQIEGLL